MKKIILLLLAISFPITVSAMSYEDVFHVGDSVNVALYSDEDVPSTSQSSDGSYNGNGFHVLKESAAGDAYVTLIYDGVVAGSPTVYDQTRPDDNYTASANYETSVVKRALDEVVAGTNPWRVVTADLLSANDLTNLGITPNAAGIYEVPAKYSFLAPIKLTGLTTDMYNYWTKIQDTSVTDSVAVYCVTYNESRTDNDGIWATLESKDITSTQSNSTCAIRPVVVVDKQYILCNNSQTPTPENVKTGVKDYIIPLFSVALIAGLSIVLLKKQSLFKEI